MSGPGLTQGASPGAVERHIGGRSLAQATPHDDAGRRAFRYASRTHKNAFRCSGSSGASELRQRNYDAAEITR